MKYIAAIVIALLFSGCDLPAGPQNNLTAGPTPAPLTINQLNQQPRVRISGRPVEGDAPVVVIAPRPGQITAGGPGSVAVDAWKDSHCRPGSPEASQYPCVTSMPNGDACQIGSCRPAEIKGLPPMFYGRTQ